MSKSAALGGRGNRFPGLGRPRRAGASGAAALGRVVYVAGGVGRGHLMSGAVVRDLLCDCGLDISVVTTSQDSRAFFEAIAETSPDILSGNFTLAFDEHYNFRFGATALGLARYALSGRGWRDINHLERLTRSAAVVINDGHPAPVLLRRRRSFRAGLVNVLSEHTIGAITGASTGWLPGALGRSAAASVRRALLSGDEAIVSTLDPTRFFTREGQVTFLPPIFKLAHPSADRVRGDLNIPAGKPLFVVYLNPYFRSPDLVPALEDVAARHGAFLYLVSESLSAGIPPGEHSLAVPHDRELANKVASADLVITAAGMAGPIQAYAYGVPLVVLVPNQPEQQHNAEVIVRSGMGAAASDLRELPAAVQAALHAKVESHPDLAPATRKSWISIVRRAAER